MRPPLLMAAIAVLLAETPAQACSLEPLRAIATELTGRATPPSADELGPRLARACPRPTGLARALKAGDDPIEDREAAVNELGRWDTLCSDMMSIPSGLETITPGQRLSMWSDCSLERFDAFEAHEWIATTGPAVSVVLLADQLGRVDGLTSAQRRSLIRGWAGIPEADQPDPELLVPFAPGAAPTIVKLADVRWPPPTLPPKLDKDGKRARASEEERDPAESRCVVDVDVVDQGGPSELHWIACPEELRPYVQSALGASWFEPAGSHGQRQAGTLRLVFEENQPRPQVEEPEGSEDAVDSAPDDK